MVDCGGLENRFVRKDDEGSNPSLSVNIKNIKTMYTMLKFPLKFKKTVLGR